MCDIIKDFVRRESQSKGAVGILVFGSFVEGKLRERSDLDLLVVTQDIKEYSMTRQRERGILLEVHRWPLKLFEQPFLGKIGNTFSDAFLFRVMRTGRILYDPKRILERFRKYAQTHRMPSSHVGWLAQKARRSLRLARSLLEEEELEGAELKIRRAAEELARAALIERDIPEIIPPKAYFPRVRDEIPELYVTLREVHNLKKIRRKKIVAALENISEWRERIVEELRRLGKEDWLKLEGVIHGVKTELSNVQDCLDDGDLESAALQTRYSAILVGSLILGLLRGKTAKGPDMQYVRLLQSNHPYGDVLRSVMDFSYDERRLEEYIEILEDIAQRY